MRYTYQLWRSTLSQFNLQLVVIFECSHDTLFLSTGFEPATLAYKTNAIPTELTEIIPAARFELAKPKQQILNLPPLTARDTGFPFSP